MTARKLLRIAEFLFYFLIHERRSLTNSHSSDTWDKIPCVSSYDLHSIYILLFWRYSRESYSSTLRIEDVHIRDTNAEYGFNLS